MIYITQESAFAPGIVENWPTVIPHPTNKNGRLVVAKDVNELIEQMRDCIYGYRELYDPTDVESGKLIDKADVIIDSISSCKS